MHTDPRLIEVANEFTLDELIRITDMKTEQEFCSRGGRSTMYPHFRNLSTHSGKVVEAYCIETTEGVTTKPEGESMSYDAILFDDIVKKHNLIGNRQAHNSYIK